MNKSTSVPQLSILIPVRNEGINIKIMLKILVSVLDVPHEILVIYDYPNEDSIPIVKKLKHTLPNIWLVRNKLGNNAADAIRTGVKEARGKYILCITADDVGPVLSIEDMLGLMERGCDIVSCTRYAHGGRRLGGDPIEGFISRIGNRLFRIIIGTTLTDSTTGIKMIRKELFDKIRPESKIGWAILFEMVIKAQILGLKLGEVPIVSIDRLYGGASNFKLGPWFKEYLKWFLYGIQHLHVSKKRKVLLSIPKGYHT